MGAVMEHNTVLIPVGCLMLAGELSVPTRLKGVVVIAHGSGSSRRSPRNRHVAEALNDRLLGTLSVDLLTASEEQEDNYTSCFRFNIDLLAARLVAITDWLLQQPGVSGYPIGYFSAGTCAAAALVAAAKRPYIVNTVVSRGGRPDLAGAALARVQSPTLFIVGEEDSTAYSENRRATAVMGCPTEIAVVPSTTHLFDEPGAPEEVARLAREWFVNHFEPVSCDLQREMKGEI
jgi:putative phosphoribosyl transferase